MLYYSCCIPFFCPPLLTRELREFQSYSLGSLRAQAPLEVGRMLKKGTMEIILNRCLLHTAGYSWWRKLQEGGEWRLIIDLWPVNSCVALLKFRMEMVTSVLTSIWKGDMFLIDLRDRYFQIPMHPELRPFLQFVGNKWTHQFLGLHFGLSSVPQVFTRVFALVSKRVHQRGIHRSLLSGWLVGHHRLVALSIGAALPLFPVLSKPGIVISKKSDLMPTQRALYHGMLMDTIWERVYPPDSCITSFLGIATKFLPFSEPPSKLWQQLLGHMASLEWFTQHRRFRMCPLQW